jgi:hypothetical protein
MEPEQKRPRQGDNDGNAMEKGRYLMQRAVLKNVLKKEKLQIVRLLTREDFEASSRELIHFIRFPEVVEIILRLGINPSKMFDFFRFRDDYEKEQVYNETSCIEFSNRDLPYAQLLVTQKELEIPPLALYSCCQQHIFQTYEPFVKQPFEIDVSFADFLWFKLEQTVTYSTMGDVLFIARKCLAVLAQDKAFFWKASMNRTSAILAALYFNTCVALDMQLYGLGFDEETTFAYTSFDKEIQLKLIPWACLRGFGKNEVGCLIRTLENPDIGGRMTSKEWLQVGLVIISEERVVFDTYFTKFPFTQLNMDIGRHVLEGTFSIKQMYFLVMRWKLKNPKWLDALFSPEDWVYLGRAYEERADVRSPYFWMLLQLYFERLPTITMALPSRYRLSNFSQSWSFLNQDYNKYPEMYFSVFCKGWLTYRKLHDLTKGVQVFLQQSIPLLKDGSTFNQKLCKGFAKETSFVTAYQSEWFRFEVLSFLCPRMFLMQSVWKIAHQTPIDLYETFCIKIRLKASP